MLQGIAGRETYVNWRTRSSGPAHCARRDHPRERSSAPGSASGDAPQPEHSGAMPVGQTLDEYIREQERTYIEETIKFKRAPGKRPRRCSGSRWQRFIASSR